MKKAVCVFYSFDEFESLLQRTVFTNQEYFSIEVKDNYFWNIVMEDSDLDEECNPWSVSDYNALPIISKLIGMRVINTHVSYDGIWFEGEAMIPKSTTRRKK